MPLEIRDAHFLIRSAQLVRGNTLRIGPVLVLSHYYRTLEHAIANNRVRVRLWGVVLND